MSNATPTRREFMRWLAGATVGPFAAPAIAASSTESANSAGRACFRDYRRRRQDEPWLGALRSVDVDAFETRALEVSGRIPDGLSGTLYRNGPAGRERAGVRYQHLFDGDGMVQAFRIDDRGIHHWGRMVRTEKRVQEDAARRFVYGGAGSQVPESKAIRNNDTTNPANISVVPFDNDLLALWEAGSAYALDPDDLRTRRRIDWSAKTARLPFSAHPVRDPDGSLWNFGLAQFIRTGVLLLYRLVPGRGLVRWGQVDLPFAGYIHSFAATRRSLVFYLSPNVFEAGQGHYVQQHRWRPDLGGRILLVDKDDFSKTRWLDAPPGFVFHMLDATEDRDGTVRFHACWHQTARVMNQDLGRLVCGEAFAPSANLTTVVVPRRGPVRLDAHDVRGEFPIAGPNGVVYVAARQQPGPWFDRLAAVDTQSGRVEWAASPEGELTEEHLYVPLPKPSPHRGLLVGTSYDIKRGRTMLNVYDARRLRQGPLARARLDRALPLGFHGCFVPA